MKIVVRSVAVVCLLLAAELHLSACWLKTPEDMAGGDWSDLSLEPTDEKHVPVKDALKTLSKMTKRATGNPTVHGSHTFGDGYTYARIRYSGDTSNVIFVLTYTLRNRVTQQSNLYRSSDYGANFTNINRLLDSQDPSNLRLSRSFYFSDFNRNFLLFPHATDPIMYYTLDEGNTFTTQAISPAAINPRTLSFNFAYEGWMMALDSNRNLYATTHYGVEWKKVASNVATYQWADSKWDDSPLSIYYTTRDPNDVNQTVNLFMTSPPYTEHHEFDAKLGDHDAFVINGPYIFAQRTDKGKRNLYVSYRRQKFQLALIPAPYENQGYIPFLIDEMQVLVVILHSGGFYNLYISDITGVYFSLSLRDIVVGRNGIDMELVNGVNGTLVANQYIRDRPFQTNAPIRTLITLDNGANWGLVLPPGTDSKGSSTNCEPPACSLHFHMASSEYYRLGVYSIDSAPGVIVAHGNIGENLTVNPDLYISRDGGVRWQLTLEGSWGVNVADHGGLLVAARDYHQNFSRELMYSCNEGQSWNSFTFTNEDTKIYGVITEPGEHTTIMSLYGVSRSVRRWTVITIDFANVFERKCLDSDYTDWMPWDVRSETDCILGSDVTIERRNPDTCCLNGRDYDREVNFVICQCTIEDYECDYGYAKPSFDPLEGPCVRTNEVKLPDPCADGQKSYNASSGYRKIAGDVCQGGVEELYKHIPAPCCGNSTLPPTLPTLQPSSNTPSQDTPSNEPSTHTPTHSTNTSSSRSSKGPSGAIVGTGVGIALVCSAALVLVIILVIAVVKYSNLRKRYARLATDEDHPLVFHSDRDSSPEPLGGNTTEDDDLPIIP